MKRTILLVILVSMAFIGKSQEFLVGAKGGLQLYKMSFDDRDLVRDGYYKSQIQGGLNGGGLVAFPLPDDFGFVFEAGYSIKGRRVIHYQNDSARNISRFTFLESAWLFRKAYPVKFYEFPAYWYINIGPNVSYWLGGSGRYKGQAATLPYSMQFTDSAESNIRVMYVENANRLQFGLNFGVGFMTSILGNQRFFAELRFTYGHTHLGEANSAILPGILNFEDNFENAYRTLNFSIGYAYHIDIKDFRKGKSTIDKRKQRSPWP